MLEQVVSEAKAIEPGREIETNFELTEPVGVDSLRAAQLFSNLLSNALTHGSRNEPVKIDAATRNGIFEFSVANKGALIPADVVGKLFLPFFRGRDRQTQQGLGPRPLHRVGNCPPAGRDSGRFIR